MDESTHPRVLPRCSLVTGAEGGEVTDLVRDADRARRLLPDHPRLPIEAGDVTDLSGCARTMSGCDAVFHTAACFREYYGLGADLQTMEQVNVASLHPLMRAAEDAGVSVFVYTSSINVLETTGPDHPADEETPVSRRYRGLGRSIDYPSSKVRAEGVVRDFARTSAMRIPIVLPGWMWGPGDAGPTSAGRLLQTVAAGRMRAVPALRNYAVDARDVADACVRAAAQPVAGRYVVAGTKHRRRPHPVHRSGDRNRRSARGPGRRRPDRGRLME